MLTLPPAVRVYVSTSPLDCRKSFDGISAQVASVLGEDPLSGHLFVFYGQTRQPVPHPVLGSYGLLRGCEASGARAFPSSTISPGWSEPRGGRCR
jgi:hypothetical protein